MTTLRIDTPRVFLPLLKPSRYKGAWGGRGSGKSHFFAELLVEKCLMQKTEWLCIREIQKSLKDSAKKLIEAKIESLGVGKYFDCQSTLIKTPHGGQIAFVGMQDHTAESIKSYEGFDGAWIEEGQAMSDRSFELLRPTIRKDGSEIWVSWNPTRKTDAVETLLRGDKMPTDAIVVRANWSDNPFFPSVLEEERQDCMRNNPDQYDHIWEGDYKTIYQGSYYTDAIRQARKEGRIGHVSRDPMMQLRAYWDLGVSDHMTIWICQFVGREVRVLDYHEATGQPLDYYVNWLRQSGYENATCYLPHDGAHRDILTATPFEDHLRQAKFKVETIPNQGKGAAMRRIEDTRRLFPSIWINEKTCKAGIDAISAYHEKKDETRGIGLGPEHDWASHGADSFGLMCSHYSPPKTISAQTTRAPVSSGWMGA